MAEQHAIRMLSTERKNVTSTQDFYTAPFGGVYRVFSNRDAHLKFGSGVTTSNGMPICQGTAIYVSMGTDESIYFLRADGETDGNIWFTKVSQA